MIRRAPRPGHAPPCRGNNAPAAPPPMRLQSQQSVVAVYALQDGMNNPPWEAEPRNWMVLETNSRKRARSRRCVRSMVGGSWPATVRKMWATCARISSFLTRPRTLCTAGSRSQSTNIFKVTSPRRVHLAAVTGIVINQSLQLVKNHIVGGGIGVAQGHDGCLLHHLWPRSAYSAGFQYPCQNRDGILHMKPDVGEQHADELAQRQRH